MERVAITSSAIAGIGYDEQSRILEIAFPSKAVWQYKEVPPLVYLAMIDAPSKGNFFATHIRGSYASKREHIPECGNESHFGKKAGDPWTSTDDCPDSLCPCFCHVSASRGESHAETKTVRQKTRDKKAVKARAERNRT